MTSFQAMPEFPCRTVDEVNKQCLEALTRRQDILKMHSGRNQVTFDTVMYKKLILNLFLETFLEILSSNVWSDPSQKNWQTII